VRISDPGKKTLFRFAIRLVAVWAIEIVGLLFMAWLLPGVWVDGLLAAIGVLNGLLWPLLSYLIEILRIYFIPRVVPARGIEYSWCRVLAQAIQTMPAWMSEFTAKPPGGRSGPGYCAG
jgi:hypothetical protein